MIKIVIAAEISNQNQINDLICRLYHHFSFVEGVKFYVFKTVSFTVGKFNVPPVFGINIEKAAIDSFGSRIVFRSIKSNFDIENVCVNAKAVIIYSEEYYKSNHLLFKVSNPKFYWCDPVKTRQEGSNFIQAALDFIPRQVSQNFEAESLEKFQKFSETINNKYKESVLLATGPSIENFERYEMADKLCFACNSTILNAELMAHAKPKVLVFADPIFHFGISKYAQTFRGICKKFLDENQHVFLIVPIKYYALLNSLFSQNKKQIIGVPFTKHRPLNVKISKTDFYTYTTANILTLLLLPLATTFTDKVNLIGCDGRSLDDDDYFWGHGKSVQINDQMSNIQECHPGFFKIDYNEYYFEHCHTLDNFILAAEVKGKAFVHLGNTHIPALSLRSVDNTLGLQSLSQQRFPTYIRHALLEPDGESASSGHFFRWHVDLAKALQQEGNSVSIVTRKDAAYSEQDISFVRLFTVRSWELQRTQGARSTTFPYNNQIKLFSVSLEEFVDSHFKKFGDTQPLHLFMYYGSVQVVKVFLELQIKYKNKPLYFTVCLFSESVNLDKHTPIQNFHPDAKKILTEAAAKSAQFRLFSVTQKLSDIIYKAFEVKTPKMPHPLINSDIAVKCIEKFEKTNRPDILKDLVTVYVPCRLGHQKSDADFFQHLEELLKITKNIVIKLRHTTESIDFYQKITDLSIKARFIVLPELNETESYFKALYDADIVFIPYTKQGFYARTSGILYDTVLSKTPVIVISDTWLADTVFQLRVGLYITYVSTNTLQAAIKRIINNYEYFKDSLDNSSELLFNRESFKNFSNKIKSSNINPFES